MKAFTVFSTILTGLIIIDRKDTIPMDLFQFQWKNRLLIIFVPDGSNSLYTKPKSEIIGQQAEVEDRIWWLL